MIKNVKLVTIYILTRTVVAPADVRLARNRFIKKLPKGSFLILV